MKQNIREDSLGAKGLNKLLFNKCIRRCASLIQQKIMRQIFSDIICSYLAHLQVLAQKTKKINPHQKKKSLYFRKWNFLTPPTLKFYYIFSKESFFYISRGETLHFSAEAQKKKKKIYPEKISYTLENFSYYIWGNGNPRKFCYISVSSVKFC